MTLTPIAVKVTVGISHMQCGCGFTTFGRGKRGAARADREFNAHNCREIAMSKKKQTSKSGKGKYGC